MAAQHLIKALHLAALGVTQGADIAQYLAGNDVLGGDDGIDAGAVDQLHIVGAGHLGQHLGYAAALSVHGHQQVFLVPVGDGHKGVRIQNPLLL